MSANNVAAAVETAPSPARKPSQCFECGGAFIPSRPTQRFCTRAHAKAFNNRSNAEGQAVVALAKAWRLARNSKAAKPVGSAALVELCAILDLFNARDREEGRPSALLYAEALLKSGQYLDRARNPFGDRS